MTEPICSVPEFYAHALAIERDAGECYAELESVFRARGALALADLAAALGRAEAGHLEELRSCSEAFAIPVFPPGSYRWLGGRSPETLPIDVAGKATSALELLELAHAAELRAAIFFESMAATTPDDDVRMPASEMAAEEREHARWVRHAMEAPALRLERERA